MNITFIIPYYGKWPIWFDSFLASCEFNQPFNWIIVSDIKYDNILPLNVKIVDMSLMELEELIRKTVGIVPKQLNPYKLCDYKIAYGLIFERWLQNCDYWGHTDMDLVYGSLSEHVNLKTLEEIDIYSPYHGSCGHFQLYRNTDKVNNFFLSMPDLEKYLKCPVTVGIDEPAFELHLRNNITINWKYLKDTERVFNADYPAIGATVEIDGSILGQPYIDEVEYKWEHGRVLQINEQNEKEFLYLHWYQSKSENEWKELAVRGQHKKDYLYLNIFLRKKNSILSRLKKLTKIIVYAFIYFIPFIKGLTQAKAYAFTKRRLLESKVRKIQRNENSSHSC